MLSGGPSLCPAWQAQGGATALCPAPPGALAACAASAALLDGAGGAAPVPGGAAPAAGGPQGALCCGAASPGALLLLPPRGPPTPLPIEGLEVPVAAIAASPSGAFAVAAGR